MTGEACKGKKQTNLFNKEQALWRQGLGRGTMTFWPAGVKHSEMVLATTKKTWPLRDEQASRGPLGAVIRFSGMQHSPQQTCQPFDSALWYLGDVSSSILVELRNLSRSSSMGTLTVKATAEDNAILKKISYRNPFLISHYHNSFPVSYYQFTITQYNFITNYELEF